MVSAIFTDLRKILFEDNINYSSLQSGIDFLILKLHMRVHTYTL